MLWIDKEKKKIINKKTLLFKMEFSKNEFNYKITWKVLLIKKYKMSNFLLAQLYLKCML